MIYFLFDNPTNKKNMEFLKEYDTASFKLIFPEERCRSIRSMLTFCGSCIKISNEEDTIICWYDFMGILCWWICRLLHKKRKIIVLNILLKNKKTLKNKLARILYKEALNSGNLEATVTSEQYGREINRMLKIEKKYTLLHDICHDSYNVIYTGDVQNNSVFCGGTNGRDWDFLFKIARNMPDIHFNVVVPKGVYNQYEKVATENVKLLAEIPLQDFLQILAQSVLVLLPLDTEAPAGLISMFQAGTNGKLVIASDTVTTREYLADGRGVLCKRSVDVWDDQIRYWLQHELEAQERAEKFKSFLRSECSKENYARTLIELCKR